MDCAAGRGVILSTDRSIAITVNTDQPNLTNRRLRSLGLGLLGVIIFALLLGLTSQELRDNILRPHPVWLGLMVFSLALTMLIFSYRLGIIAASTVAGHRTVSPWRLYLYSVSSLAAAIIAPQTLGIMVIRSAALNRLGGISIRMSVTAVFFDKLFDALAMVLFAWPGFLLLLHLASLEQVILISVVEVALTTALLVWRHRLVLAIMQRLVKFGVAVVSRIPLLRNTSMVKNLQIAQQPQEWSLLQQQVLLQSFSLTLVGQLGLVLRSWCIARAIGLDIEFGAVFVGVAFAQFMQLIAFTPGAIGLVEAAWYLVFASSGITGEQILSFVIAHRVFENLGIAFIWIVLYLFTVLWNRLKPHSASR